MTIIILAAGLSTRMGENKLLLPFNGSTIIENTLKSIIPSADRILVVVGNEEDRIKKVLDKYDVRFVENKEYEKGQRSSTIKGIENVGDDDFAILPGDLPLLKEDDARGTIALLSEYTTARAIHGSIPGHPVAYRKENRERILSFPGSMKEYLNSTNLGLYKASIGAIFDVDTPTRYERLLSGNLDSSSIC